MQKKKKKKKKIHIAITMKVAIVLCVCLAVAMAQFNQHGGNHGNHNGQHHGGHDPLAALVHNEVVELVKANAGLTSAECTSKCDALFGLLESHDEQSTDDHCKHACECDIDQVGCPNNMHSGAPMQPTQSAIKQMASSSSSQSDQSQQAHTNTNTKGRQV